MKTITGMLMSAIMVPFVLVGIFCELALDGVTVGRKMAFDAQ